MELVILKNGNWQKIALGRRTSRRLADHFFLAFAIEPERFGLAIGGGSECDTTFTQLNAERGNLTVSFGHSEPYCSERNAARTTPE